MLALRVTYLGELGWELHVPTEYAAHVYERCGRPDATVGIADAGYRAIDSLRLEKRYLYWGADITPDYTPYEAGLGFAVSLKKKADFIGRAALEKAKAAGPARKLITLLVDADVQLYGGEAIRRDGKVLGVTSIAGWGHTIGKAVAFGYVPAEEAGHADYEIEAFTRRHAATRIDGAAVDPRAQEDPGLATAVIPSVARDLLLHSKVPRHARDDRISISTAPRRPRSASGARSSPPRGRPEPLSRSSTSITRARQRFSSAWPLAVAVSRRMRPCSASADFLMAPILSRLRTITLMVCGVRKVSRARSAPETPG